MKAKYIPIILSLGLGCFTTQSFAYNEDLFGDSASSQVVSKPNNNTEIKIDPEPIKPTVSTKPVISTHVEKPLFAEKTRDTNSTAKVDNKVFILVPIESNTPKTKIRLPSEFENIPPLTKWVDYKQYLKEQKEKQKNEKAVEKPVNTLIQKANQNPDKYVDEFFDYNKQNTTTNIEDKNIKSGMGALLSEYGVNGKPAAVASTTSNKTALNLSMNAMAQRYVPLPRAIDNYSIPESQLGKQVYIRIFKQEHSLELYLKQGDTFQLANIYDICTFYGGLGPKRRSGDNKSPEGFYKAQRSSLQPNSSYYKAINIGFPNAYDRAHGYTGQYLMIHGGCKSIGCYAMTNDYIREIYKFVEYAFNNGQTEISMDIYPFKMTDTNMNKNKKSDNYDFWKQLLPGYLYFEKYKVPPSVDVVNGKYVVEGADKLTVSTSKPNNKTKLLSK